MSYEAKIIADSISEAGDRLTTFQVTFPRIVLAEYNTHRALSKNSASSRAIPVEKQIRKVLDDPFIPVYWGKNQKGMQAEQELTEYEQRRAVSEWLLGREWAVQSAESLLAKGVHKQIANRLLEPFMWQTCITSATEYSNFFALRANPMAQPEIRVIAEMMKELYETNEPNLLKIGEWHLPYTSAEDYWSVDEPEDIRKVSAARCARVSYLTQEGKRDIQADLDLYERLAGSGHLSPLEHLATPMKQVYVKDMSYAENVSKLDSLFYGNFKGWKQLRKFIPNEDDFGKVSNA